MKASSFADCENAVKFRDVFAVLKPICENPKGEGLGFRHRFVARDSIGENTWEFGDLANPPTVLFTLDFDVELAHSKIVSPSRSDAQWSNSYIGSTPFYPCTKRLR